MFKFENGAIVALSEEEEAAVMAAYEDYIQAAGKEADDTERGPGSAYKGAGQYGEHPGYDVPSDEVVLSDI